LPIVSWLPGYRRDWLLPDVLAGLAVWTVILNAVSPTYGPSKAALEALSAIMAKDLDGTGVTVNVLVPGGITKPEVTRQG
jgi:NAD(P)-dependent dehydrogenase (short-subunit alcohol dehydrogenase family)